MLRLRRVQIHRFRDVAPGTVLEFADGVNALIGLNGTGKTTLLNLLSALLRFDVSGFREEFDVEVWPVTSGALCHEFKYRIKARTASSASDSLRMSTMADEAPHGGLLRNSYELELDVELRDPASNNVFIAHVGRDGIVEAGGDRIDRRVDLGAPGFIENLGRTLMSLSPVTKTDEAPQYLEMKQQGIRLLSFLGAEATTGRLDEGLDAFRAMTDGEESGLFDAPPVAFAVVNEVVSGRTLAWGSERPESVPRWLAHIPPDGPVDPTLNVPLVAIGLEGLPSAIGAQDIEFRFQRVEERDIKGARRFEFKGCGLDARWSPGSASRHTQWSFGQKRIAAFFYYAACVPEGVILADELSNGMHHRMLETCIELIGERQAILATQNPLLLDHLWFESAEMVRRSFVLCEVRRREGGGREWVWRNPTVEEAESVYAAYKVDVQHVSEILRSKGLW